MAFQNERTTYIISELDQLITQYNKHYPIAGKPDIYNKLLKILKIYDPTNRIFDNPVVSKNKKDKEPNNNIDNEKLKELVHFFDCLDIKGLGHGTIKQIFEAGYTDVKSITTMSEKDFIRIQGYKKIELYKSIKQSMNGMMKCSKLMMASNCFGGIGKHKLKIILTSYDDLNSYVPTIDELIAIEGIKTVTANKFLEGLKKYRAFLKSTGLQCISVGKTINKPVEETPHKNTLKNEVIEFSVLLKNFIEKETLNNLKEKITALGGAISSKTTKKTKPTTILLVYSYDQDHYYKDHYYDLATFTKAEKEINTARELGIRVMEINLFRMKYTSPWFAQKPIEVIKQQYLRILEGKNEHYINLSDKDTFEIAVEEYYSSMKEETNEEDLYWFDHEDEIQIPTYTEFRKYLSETLKNNKTTKPHNQTFQDEVVVFSGFRDKDLAAKIEEMGGKTESNKMYPITILILKDMKSESIKTKKAREAGAVVMTKDDFLQKYKSQLDSINI